MSGPGPVGGPGPVTGGGALDALRDGRIKDPEARLRTAARLLESSFYQELFKAMRATVPESGITGGGSGEDMFQSLMDERVAEAAALRQERGLGRALYRYFTRGTAAAVGTDPHA